MTDQSTVRELLTDMADRFERGEIIGQTQYAAMCAQAMRAIVAAPATPAAPGGPTQDQIEQAVAILRIALTEGDASTVRALIQAALDFATNDEEALAMGREFQDAASAQEGR